MSRNSNWRRSAACVGMDEDLFFDDDPEREAEAKKVCASCIVQRDCLAESLAMPLELQRHGVFGGLGPDDRRELWQRKRTGTVVHIKEEQNA